VNVGVVRIGIRKRVPIVVNSENVGRAAVALILREAGRGAEFLAIQRAERPGDPWSGHMALPGGRTDPSDHDLFATAARETREEVGIDLLQHGTLIGHLDELQAVGGGKVLPLVITPIACEISAPVTLQLNSSEVRDAVWIPLAALRRADVQGHFTYELDGTYMRHAAYVYEGYTIWGLTYRILANLLVLLD